MVTTFLLLVLKIYGKSFLKMFVSPDFNSSTFPAFVFFLVSLITLLVFQEKSRFIGIGSVSRFPEMHEAKIVFFWSRKSSKTVSSSINQTHWRVMEPELKFPALGPAEGIHSHWLQIRLQIIAQLLNFRLWRQFRFHYLKNFGSTIKNCLGSGSTALPTSSLLVAI